MLINGEDIQYQRKLRTTSRVGGEYHKEQQGHCFKPKTIRLYHDVGLV